MERLRLLVDMLRFKVTIFSTIVGGALYLVLNKGKILDMIDKWVFFFVVVVLLGYGTIGFVHNFSLLTKYLRKLQKEIDREL